MNLQGQSEFSVETGLSVDEVVDVTNGVLRAFAARTPIVTHAWAEPDDAGDVRVQVMTVSSSYAQVESEMDSLAGEIVDALRARKAGTRVSRGATELVPA